MKKSFIANKNLDIVGFHSVNQTLDTKKCTIERKVYYNGKINQKETKYFENELILNIIWDNDIRYYQEKEYTFIEI